MDLWQWVENLQSDLIEAGQPHNAQLIDNISSYYADNEVAKAEAALPEAKALCKTLNNPWLSVYVGHWEMRHRIANKKEGEIALADIVELFEFSHRQDTEDCPQSVCVTQDLAACYGIIDGIGWADERIAVSEETIDRIDPSWNCYQCLSCEKGRALIDKKQPQQALDYLADIRKVLEQAGKNIGPGIIEVENHALNVLGRYTDVLSRIEEAELAANKLPYTEWKNISQPRALQKVYVLARLNQDDDALEALPHLRDIHIGDMFDWLEAIYPVLLRNKDMNVWQLGRQLQAALEHLSNNGAHRMVIDMANMTIRLAVARGAHWSAQRQLSLAQTHQPKLRVDGGAQAILIELQQLIDQMPDPQLPVPANQLIQWLNGPTYESTEESEQSEQFEQSNHVTQDSSDHNTVEPSASTATNDLPAPPKQRDPEQEIEWLLAALGQLPEDAELNSQTASALQAMGASEDGIELLWRYVQQTQGSNADNTVRFGLLELLLETGDEEGVHKVAQLFEDSQDREFSNWCLAQLAYQQLDWTQAESYLRNILSLNKEAYGAKSMLARCLMQQRQFSLAANEYQELVDALPENNDFKWDFLTAASAAQQWRKVRQMANNHLNIEIAINDDEPNENWGWVIIRYIENGDIKEYYAQRTGPVSALILENAPPMSKQHVGDHVVFDAQVLNTPPEDPQEKEDFIPSFAEFSTLTNGNYRNSIFLEGAYPGDALFEAFEESCRELGWKLWIHSRSDYQIIDSENDDAPLKGLMITLAVPQSVSDLQVNTMLTEQTKDWPHKLCWLSLAETVGCDTQPHKDVIERYGL